MKAHCYDPGDCIFIVGFLATFMLICDTNCVHKRAAMWLLSSSVKNALTSSPKLLLVSGYKHRTYRYPHLLGRVAKEKSIFDHIARTSLVISRSLVLTKRSPKWILRSCATSDQPTWLQRTVLSNYTLNDVESRTFTANLQWTTISLKKTTPPPATASKSIGRWTHRLILAKLLSRCSRLSRPGKMTETDAHWDPKC